MDGGCDNCDPNDCKSSETPPISSGIIDCRIDNNQMAIDYNFQNATEPVKIYRSDNLESDPSNSPTGTIVIIDTINKPNSGGTITISDSSAVVGTDYYYWLYQDQQNQDFSNIKKLSYIADCKIIASPSPSCNISCATLSSTGINIQGKYNNLVLPTDLYRGNCGDGKIKLETLSTDGNINVNDSLPSGNTYYNYNVCQDSTSLCSISCKTAAEGNNLQSISVCPSNCPSGSTFKNMIFNRNESTGSGSFNDYWGCIQKKGNSWGGCVPKLTLDKYIKIPTPPPNNWYSSDYITLFHIEDTTSSTYPLLMGSIESSPGVGSTPGDKMYIIVGSSKNGESNATTWSNWATVTFLSCGEEECKKPQKSELTAHTSWEDIDCNVDDPATITSITVTQSDIPKINLCQKTTKDEDKPFTDTLSCKEYQTDGTYQPISCENIIGDPVSPVSFNSQKEKIINEFLKAFGMEKLYVNADSTDKTVTTESEKLQFNFNTNNSGIGKFRIETEVEDKTHKSITTETLDITVLSASDPTVSCIAPPSAPKGTEFIWDSSYTNCTPPTYTWEDDLTNPAGIGGITTSSTTITYTTTGEKKARIRIDCAGGKTAISDLCVTNVTPVAPTCNNFKFIPNPINRGDSGTLEIETSNVVTASYSCNGNLGNGNFNWNGSKFIKEDLSPTDTQICTATVSSATGGTVNCTTVAGVNDLPITVLQPNLTCAFGYNGVAPQRFPNINLPIGGTLNNIKFTGKNEGTMNGTGLFNVNKTPYYDYLNNNTNSWTKNPNPILTPGNSFSDIVDTDHLCDACGGPVVYSGSVLDLTFPSSPGPINNCDLTINCGQPTSCDGVVETLTTTPDKIFLGKNIKINWKLDKAKMIPGYNPDDPTDYCICKAVCNDDSAQYNKGCGKDTSGRYSWEGTFGDPAYPLFNILNNNHYVPDTSDVNGYGFMPADTYKNYTNPYRNEYKIVCYNAGYSDCDNANKTSIATVTVLPIPWYQEREPSTSLNILNKLGAYLLNLIGW
ncbi:MAG: hypothetical protein NTW73_03470 [Candidatus Parcubacteria bacterium]|nr:hypothetical protein [Candidatus Parcubacteria bacterium]